MRRHQIAGIALVLYGIAACLVLAEDVPYGHPDFYPSPDRPVGWRGDGNGAFPGATPVTNFWDGRPVRKRIPDRKDKSRKQEVWDVADDKSHNIVWKVRTPGFANSCPIIVGDLVFATAEPYLLLCLDIHTGKMIWQRNLRAFDLMDDVSEGQADGFQDYIEMSEAFHYLMGSLLCNYASFPTFKAQCRRQYIHHFRDAEAMLERIIVGRGSALRIVLSDAVL